MRIFDSRQLGGEWRDRLAANAPVAILTAFIVALLVRALYLIYLQSLNWPDQWFHVDRASYIMAMHMFGLPISSELQSQLIDLRGAQQEFMLNDPGLTYLYYFVGKLVGHPSFAAVQWLQVAADSCMVFPMAYIGRKLAGVHAGKWAAWSYVFFIPQIHINAMPHYSAWLTYGYILSTALFIFAETGSKTRKWARFTSACLVVFVTSFLRSSISFFGIAYVLLMTAGGLIFRRRMAWSFLVLGLIVSGSFVIARSKIDLSGEGIPVRSTIAHSLMVGVGQFKNPLGLVANDGSPFEWYKRENPGSLKHLEQFSAPTNSPEYNAWLMGRFKEFVASYPVLYASMVIRRALMILIPNFKLSPYADIAQYAIMFKERNDEITALSANLSSRSTGLGEKFRILWRIGQLELSYVVLLPFRFFFMLVLPIGLFSALWRPEGRQFLVAAMTPLLYAVGTVSWVYGPGHLHISAWAAVLPVVVLGWLGLWDYFGRFRRQS